MSTELFGFSNDFWKACEHFLMELRIMNPEQGLVTMVDALRRSFYADLGGLVLVDSHIETVVPIFSCRAVRPPSVSGVAWLGSLDPGDRTQMIHELRGAKSSFWLEVKIAHRTTEKISQSVAAIYLDAIVRLLPEGTVSYLLLVFEDPGELFPPGTRDLQTMILTGLIQEGVRTLDRKGVLQPPTTSETMAPNVQLAYLLDTMAFLKALTPPEV